MKMKKGNKQLREQSRKIRQYTSLIRGARAAARTEKTQPNSSDRTEWRAHSFANIFSVTGEIADFEAFLRAANGIKYKYQADASFNDTCGSLARHGFARKARSLASKLERRSNRALGFIEIYQVTKDPTDLERARRIINTLDAEGGWRSGCEYAIIWAQAEMGDLQACHALGDRLFEYPSNQRLPGIAAELQKKGSTKGIQTLVAHVRHGFDRFKIWKELFAITRKAKYLAAARNELYKARQEEGSWHSDWNAVLWSELFYLSHAKRDRKEIRLKPTRKENYQLTAEIYFNLFRATRDNKDLAIYRNAVLHIDHDHQRIEQSTNLFVSTLDPHDLKRATDIIKSQTHGFSTVKWLLKLAQAIKAE